jgi:peptide/nickel transport system ATP-binding protein
MTDSAALTLDVQHLAVDYSVKGKLQRVLQDVSIRIRRGEAYGLVGESGCGKSTVAYAVLRYLPRNGFVGEGRVLIGAKDLYNLDRKSLRELRRTSIAMVYQDPSRALNPSMPVGRQVQEVFELAGVPRKEWDHRVEAILGKVRIVDPRDVMRRYPHQLSGGMQQRVAIAMALASDPALLILDEPTTGLDATVEAEVLDLIVQLRKEFSTSILFISHNLAVIGRMCDRVGVLYSGRLVEEGPAAEIFHSPKHPYTIGLLNCLPQQGRSKHLASLPTIAGFPPAPGEITAGCVFSPRCERATDICRKEVPKPTTTATRTVSCHHIHKVNAESLEPPKTHSEVAMRAPGETVLQLEGLSKTFGRVNQGLKVLNDVSLTLRAGETLGLVGESGSGKTTLARCILGLLEPDAGSRISIGGETAAGRLKSRRLDQVKALQIVFQNPDSALNRSHAVRRMIGRTIQRLVGLTGEERDSRVRELAGQVRLAERYLDAKPRQLSGGLKQRVAIARAFSGDPDVVICDEPTSALDVSVQAAILNLLTDLQQSHQVSYIFISHDLGVVRYISDRIAVLYLGQVMELGPAEAVFNGPHHPYTEALLSSVSYLHVQQADRVKLAGEIPSAAHPPTGCVFHTRCQRKIGAICENQVPPTVKLRDGHAIKCHLPVESLHSFR